MSQPTGESVKRLGCGIPCVRILIADDQQRARQSLKALLTALRWSIHVGIETSIEIVGEADDGLQAVTLVQTLHPDVVVLDLLGHDSAPRGVKAGSTLDNLATIRSIKSQWPMIRVVVLTMYATDRSAALLAGADAFLLKGCPTSELLDAVMPTAC